MNSSEPRKLSIDFLLNPVSSSPSYVDAPTSPLSALADATFTRMQESPQEVSVLGKRKKPLPVTPTSHDDSHPSSTTYEENKKPLITSQPARPKRRRISRDLSSSSCSEDFSDEERSHQNRLLSQANAKREKNPHATRERIAELPETPTPNLFERIQALPETPVPVSLDALLKTGESELLKAFGGGNGNDSNHLSSSSSSILNKTDAQHPSSLHGEGGDVAMTAFEASFPSKKGLAPLKTRKRPNAYQRAFLEYVFRLDPWPDTASKLLIAQKIQMTPQQINTWFQNKRARSKKTTRGTPAADFPLVFQQLLGIKSS